MSEPQPIDRVPQKVLAGYGYGTHLPALMDAFLRTSGPVLEMGAGWWSTPLLHDLCRQQERTLTTVEAVDQWRRQFLDLAGPYHRFRDDPDDPMINVGRYGVILIDHATVRRQPDLIRLADKADLIVCHDANCANYRYDFSPFKFRRLWAELSPATMVVSNVIQP